MQKILVAGGAGFIGSHLCELLLKNNDNRIICIDNLITGDKKNIEHLLKNPQFEFIQYDVIKPLLKYGSQLTNLNYIFHLASPASPNKKSPRSYVNHPIETLLINSIGTHQLLELARKSKAKFLYASSSEVYGDPKVSPQKEEYFGNVNPIGIRSVYDEGKRFGEAMTMAYFRKHSLDVRIIRIFNTYGPRMQKDDGRVIANFVNQAINNQQITVYGDGSQTRSCCYIDDMVDGLERTMFRENTKGEVINLGSPDERKILEIAKLIKRIANSSSEIVFEALPEDDPTMRKPSIGKAKELLNWFPKIGLEEGLKRTIDYFKAL